MSLGKKLNIITENHLHVPRDYSQRACPDKVKNSELAKKFDFDYWDGARNTGYGGYKNDGRWKKIAKKLIDTYDLNSKGSILDIGCGKGYLLSELNKINPQLKISGVDISQYALLNLSLYQLVLFSASQERHFKLQIFENLMSKKAILC